RGNYRHSAIKRCGDNVVVVKSPSADKPVPKWRKPGLGLNVKSRNSNGRIRVVKDKPVVTADRHNRSWAVVGQHNCVAASCSPVDELDLMIQARDECNLLVAVAETEYVGQRDIILSQLVAVSVEHSKPLRCFIRCALHHAHRSIRCGNEGPDPSGSRRWAQDAILDFALTQNVNGTSRIKGSHSRIRAADHLHGGTANAQHRPFRL